MASGEGSASGEVSLFPQVSSALSQPVPPHTACFFCASLKFSFLF